jgi:ParB family chromosome partitioning protein
MPGKPSKKTIGTTKPTKTSKKIVSMKIKNPESSCIEQIDDLKSVVNLEEISQIENEKVKDTENQEIILISEEITQVETEKAKDTKNHEKIHISEKILELDIDKIEHDPEQPRKNFDLPSLNNLKDSIEKTKLLDPILVRENDLQPGFYLIIDGERRWRACKDLNLNKIQCRVVTSNAEGYRIVALTRNIQREDLLPIEKANAFKALLDKMKSENENMMQKDLVKILNLSASFISEVISISSLEDVIKEEASKSKEWSQRKLLQLYKIKSPALRMKKFEEFKRAIAKKTNKEIIANIDKTINNEQVSPEMEVDSDTVSISTKNPITLKEIKKRIKSFTKYLQKISKNDLNPFEIKEIQEELDKLNDIFI